MGERGGRWRCRQVRWRWEVSNRTEPEETTTSKNGRLLTPSMLLRAANPTAPIPGF